MKRNWNQRIALVLSGAMLAGCLTGCGGRTEPSQSEAVTTAETDAIAEAAASLLKTHGSTEGKEETVYVVADATGKPTQTIVSSWLKNPEELDTISDVSNLTDIQNVKGDETFTAGAGNTLQWQANGSDIYYQGRTTQQLPVDVSISYALDGVETAPEALDGASGHLTIHFAYENRLTRQETVDGKQVTLYQPFTVISGIALDNTTASNISVTHGKVINSGSQSVVVGMAMPGLKESLGLDTLKDAEGESVDIDIPEDVTIEADVQDFSMLTSLTMVDNSFLSEVDLQDIDSLDELEAAMEELTDASSKLVDGTGALYDGASQLKDGTGRLADGAKALNDGAGRLDDGAAKLDEGASALKDGSKALDDGADTLSEGMVSLKSGARTVATKLSELYTGTVSLNDGAGKLTGGLDQLSKQVSVLPSSASALYLGSLSLKSALSSGDSGKPGIYEAAQAIQSGAKQMTAGLDNDSDEHPGILQGAAAIQSGADKIGKGAASIAAGAKSGDADNPGIYEAAAGIEQGAGQLLKGMDAIPGAVSKAVGSAVSDQTEQAQGALSAASGKNAAASQTLKALLEDETLTDEQRQAVQSALTDVQTGKGYVDAVSDGLSSPDLDGLEEEIEGRLAPASQGLTRIQGAASQIRSGAEAISGGAGEIETGAQRISGGAERIGGGAKALKQGSQQIDSASGQIAGGVQTMLSGNDGNNLNAMTQGLKQLKDTAPALVNGIDKLDEGAHTLNQGSKTLMTGAEKLAKGGSDLSDGVNSAAAGAAQLKDGASKLSGGASELKDGTKELKAGTSQLSGGTKELLDGTDDLNEGVAALFDGAKELKEGMAQFDAEGIEKLSDLFHDDGQDLIERLRALQDYARSYTTFSGAGSETPCEVRFIIRTESIGA